jgi:CRISPR-associated protein Cas1
MTTLACEALPHVRAVPDLVPARMLNEYCYCPRLAYLEWVQGEFAHSADTVDGRRTHRRVDQPGGALPSPEADGPEAQQRIHARSVHLSAPELGAQAVIDLLEGAAGAAGTVTPVDYKKGRVPDNPERAWQPDRIQLCLQGMILEENGYECSSGVLYYAQSKTRVEVPFDLLLRAQVQDLLLGIRELDQQPIPPPLVDSPKCPRCSLVGICLPDETRALAATPATSDDAPRRLIAPRSDKRALYVQDQSASLGVSGDEIVIRHRKDQTVIGSARLSELDHLAIFGNIQLSTQAQRRLLDEGIPVTYFSFGGWFCGMTVGLPSKNIEIRQRQYAAAAHPSACLTLAQAFVAGKIQNQRTLLRRNHPDAPAADLARLKTLADGVRERTDLPSLLGHEGLAARTYFQHFEAMLKPRDPNPANRFDFSFDGRNRRPPRDPVNALLSYAYAILAKDLTVACWAVGLDPYLGFFHQPRFGRPSLALDLQEEFRPLIADSTVLTAINTGVVNVDDFERRGTAVALKPEGRKRFLAAYERRMDSELTHPLFQYKVSYRRALELQARILSRVLLGEIPAYQPLVTR